MQLESVTIKNYRSIKDTALTIQKIANKYCFIMLGINESGKSNFLKAIALKDSKDINYNNDCEKNAGNKNENISITYTLISNEKLNKKFISKGIPENLAKIIELEKIQKQFDFNSNNEIVNCFHIYIKDNQEFSRYVLFNNEIQIITAKNQEVGEEGKLINLLNKEKLERFLGDNVFSDDKHSIPKVIFWKSEDKYLINQQIDLNVFKDNPSISIPLKNCFNIAGITNILQEINRIVNEPSKKLTLEKKLSNKVTEYINAIWIEHKINIRFSIDTMKLSFLIEDKEDDTNNFEISQRSDGFKQFISILLNLSIENETKELKNKIILLDEPEIHLHPSGQKYLKAELLKIAENNIVIYATHSTYMADTQNLDRHFSVKKDSGITIIKQIDRNNPYGDEVLYNALGTSILEHIEPNVLIVEGKTDKDIFNLYCKKFKTELKPPKITVIPADGVKSIIKYTRFFNINIIKGFVLVDSDAVGTTEKNKIRAEDNYDEKNTFEINDIHDTKILATLEDLFDKQYLEKAIKDIFGVDMVLNESKPLMKQHKDKYKEHDQKKLKTPFMEAISGLPKEKLKKEKYYSFFKNLIEKIQ